ncbi:sulfate/molybdate ABC transporter ATP-binding protein [Solimonas marina]|uniref:Sulfate/molybdate ABC transporter ATP-binding protein n=1 Tax=Solimonas marina TaxID=2714601 RepID=A0A970B5K6_9GAMM|nr:sulfate/molybdate ABC transporter ATP-binding protein [Solimonas marina]NKF21680.1 sulfate/molybdate ABC transporter ATP-binding protein [Solimonas marina]
MDIQIRKLHKSFGDFNALAGVDLDIASGELIALLGPSGSGKTTLLRCIAGLEFPDRGEIRFDGEDVAERPVRERRVGFVFQHYALFRHMSVLDNVAFGLRVRERRERQPEALIRQRARELIELVQLAGLEKRYPSQLSGGQKQRVALARALAIEPRVLLLDEPFGALDARVRKDLRQWLRELHRRTGYSTLFVTHDQEEALELADRVVIMNHGAIEQIGSVDEVYERPASPFVFDFLGDTNVLRAQVHERRVQFDGADIAVLDGRIHPDGAADVHVRPGDLRLGDGGIGLDVVVQSLQRTGPVVRAVVQTSGSKAPVRVEWPHLHHDVPALRPGAQLRLRLLQFSLYTPQSRPPTSSLGAPILIGQERRRDHA